MSIESGIRKPSCFLLGNTSLLITCCDQLLLKNWKILGIISADYKVTEYAEKKGISLKDQQTSIFSFLSQTSFDYLFSIVNEFILDKTIFNLPLRLAVNYHDSLLPEGAGVFSTTWALINREQNHGISWHIIDEGIDTGDLLVQKKIEIENDESSISLNVKCYQNAIESFVVLLNDLENNSFNRVKQDQNKRTYFPKNKRPLNVGILNFSKSELSLKSMLNAFDFGKNLDNDFCSPKIYLGNRFYIPSDYRWKTSQKNIQIGSVEEATPEGILIRMEGEALLITRMTTMEGEKVELDALLKDTELNPGVLLSYPEASYLSHIHGLYERIIGYEDFWVRKLCDLNLVKFPFIHSEKSGIDDYSIEKFELKDELLAYCEQINSNGIELNLYSLILLYISRLSDNAEFDIWFKIETEYSRHSNLFSPYVPLGCKFEKQSAIAENLDLANDHIKQTIRKGTFVRDIFLRKKILREADIKSVTKKIPFFIGGIDNPNDFESVLPIDWGILVSLNTRALFLVYNKSDCNTIVAEKFFHHFTVFSHNIINQKDTVLSKVQLLSKLEKDQKIVDWNRIKVEYPDDVCIHELIENWAAKTPEETAIVLKDEKISYRELNEKADNIAAYIMNKGVCEGDRVGVMMDRSINTVVSFLGVLKTGATYVPLDINLPVSRLEYMIEDSGIKALITDWKISDSSFKIETLLFSDCIQTRGKSAPFPKVQSDSLAYIKYTSGSTGNPKGVMIMHKNVVGFLYSIRHVVKVYEKRIGTCVAPLSFDTSVEEVYSCLCFGGTVHIMLKEQTTDLEYFAGYLVDKKVNVSYIIPEFIEGVGTYLKNESTISLKTLLTGLYAKKNSVFRPFFELRNPVRVINTYGPTEVTYGSNAYQLKGDEDPLENTPIGKPFPNYATYIVDSDMQLLPDFIQGELIIGGVGISKGYINKPDITALKFVDFESENFRTRVYKSGDVVYSVPSGDIHFVGRNDDQVKIRGYRIEISEIVEALNSHANVKTSIVIKRKGEKNHDQLIAYILLRIEMENAEIQIHKFLEDKIPGYMIPAFIVLIDSIPLFPNGKTNFALLPEPSYHNNSDNQDIKKPETETEEKIKQIFEEHLDCENIGVEDNYFDLGGDSITAVHIMQQIEDVFGKKFPISLLYKYSSIRKLADSVSKQTSEEAVNAIIPIREGGDGDPIFFLHDMTGSVLGYSNIIKNLDKRFPVYGIQSDYKTDFDIQKDGIEKLAGTYIKYILSVTGKKCIVLIGRSFSGYLAFEIARQLDTLGYGTRLIIIDSNMKYFYNKLYPRKFMVLMILNWIKWVAVYICKSIFMILKTRDYKYLLNAFRRIKFETLYYLMKREEVLQLLEQKNNQISLLNENINISYKLVDRYYPEVYKGNLFLIQCKGETEGELVNTTKSNFFRSYVSGKLFIKQINATHSTMLNKQNVEMISQMINSFLLSGSESC